MLNAADVQQGLMDLDEAAMKRFCPFRTFERGADVWDMDYSPSGETFSIGLGKHLKIYNALRGRPVAWMGVYATLFSYMREECILYSSGQEIALLDLPSSRDARSFGACVGEVTFISASLGHPSIFLSSGREGVAVWDLRLRNPACRIRTRNGLSCFFGDGFALCTDTFLRLYDFRLLKGPERTAQVPHRRHECMAAAGKYLCVGNDYEHDIYDREGTLLQGIRTGCRGSAAFTPNSSYLLYSSGPLLFYYDTVSRTRVHATRESFPVVRRIRFNPQYAQFATVGPYLRIWMPDTYSNAECFDDTPHVVSPSSIP